MKWRYLSSFVRDYLGTPAGVDADELKLQIETLKKQNEAKDVEIASLKKQVCIFGVALITKIEELSAKQWME